jgi:uroporphyrinogen decarboxylase
MNSKQRILTALNREQPDRVPIMEVIDERVLYKLASILGLEVEERDDDLRPLCLLSVVAEKIGLDYVEIPPGTGEKPIDAIHVRDRFGCTFAKSEHGMKVLVDGPIKAIDDVTAFDMACGIRDEDFSGLRYVFDRIGDQMAVGLFCMDPFKISWLLRGGMQELLLDFALDPQLVHNLARIATDYDLGLIEAASNIGVKVMSIDGDLASEMNTLMSPTHYRRYIKPYQKELIEYAHQRGMKVYKHSDGNVWPILDDFIEIGFDGYNPIQPQCMDIAEVKRHVSGRICLIGNIDCRYLLCSGTEEQVEEEVRCTIESAAPGGAYILSSSNSIHPGVKPENYLAMMRAARRYGSYREL